MICIPFITDLRGNGCSLLPRFICQYLNSIEYLSALYCRHFTTIHLSVLAAHSSGSGGCTFFMADLSALYCRCFTTIHLSVLASHSSGPCSCRYSIAYLSALYCRHFTTIHLSVLVSFSSGLCANVCSC